MSTTLTKPETQPLRHRFRHDPFSNLQKEIMDLFRGSHEPWSDEPATTLVPVSVDLSETDESFEICMDVPGVKVEDIDVEVVGNTVRISGRHREEKEEKGKTYHRVGRRCGSFSRGFDLLSPINEAQVTAECADGVLTVALPKTEVAKTQKIKVSAK